MTPLIDIELVLHGLADDVVGSLIEPARAGLQSIMQAEFPEFEWRISTSRIDADDFSATGNGTAGQAAEPSDLLQLALGELERLNRDFVLLITGARLAGLSRTNVMATPSKAMSVAVVSISHFSTAQLSSFDLPTSRERLASHKGQAGDRLIDRLQTLCVHLLGDLNGVAHSSSASDFMFYPVVPADLDAMVRFDHDSSLALRAALINVSDARLEERPDYRLASVPMRYLIGVWHLRSEIASAVWQAQPWQFPLRLKSLTTAAISTLLVLIMTSETWQLGMSQSVAGMTVFALIVFCAASGYVLKRQRLLFDRSNRRLTETRITIDTTIVAIVFVGMGFTYLLLFAVTLALGQFLFSPELVTAWVPSITGAAATTSQTIAMAQLVAAFGLAIGSLGSSFEGETYFRHVAYVDEEI